MARRCQRPPELPPLSNAAVNVSSSGMLTFRMPFRKAGVASDTTTPWLTLLLFCITLWATCAQSMTDEAIATLRQETRDIFYHGYDNYLEHAFPEDELRPLTCGALTRDRANPAHIEVNDVLGNYSLTLIDSLSTLAILASSPPPGKSPNRALREFQDAIALLVEYYGDGTEGPQGQGKRARAFDLDSKVQVFETVIRGVGGLLSAHLFAVGELPIRGYDAKVRTRRGRTGIAWPNGFVYDGQLLRLAHDLGKRLLPAFETVTGIPYPRVNLRTGIPFYLNAPRNADAGGECPRTQPAGAEITETCSAGAGSLVLEFTTLSRLTGDQRFEEVAKTAFWSVWQRRSSIGLIGGGIDAESGQWVGPYTGVGAGIDSFFEYAFKSHILLSGLPTEQPQGSMHPSDIFLHVWQEAHAAIKRHIYRGESFQHPHYVQGDLYTGALRAFWIDSLSAYYPGLLTLSGELEEAISTHLLYTALWTRYSALPERWSTATGRIEGGLRWWGGRPEFIESTWYIFRATKDPWYLHVGEMALRDIKRRCWTECGWAGLQDVRTGELSDRMESFFLGETVKYLFLLFDESHPLNHMDAPVVFTTEGHPLVIPRTRGKYSESTSHDPDAHPDTKAVCPKPPAAIPLTFSSTAARSDIFHAASLARLHLLEDKQTEYTTDDPSTSHPSPTNHTFYPWTLPPSLIPANGTCAPIATRSTFDLSFPNFPDGTTSLSSLTRVSEGILVGSMSGLRLGMVRDDPPLFRIYTISNVALGRDEKVFLPRSILSTFHPVDPYFTRIRDTQRLDLVLEIGPETLSDPTPDPDPDAVNASHQADPGLLTSILSTLSSILLDPPTPLPVAPQRTELSAALPAGPGAAPLPDIPDADDGPLPWTSVYIADSLCSGVLDASVVRNHHILVVRRGGCSFGDKLRNIPSFAPSAQGLQVVVVVSGDDGEEGLVQPLLDHVQRTPGGLVRVNPLAMMVVGGGEGTVEMLRRVRGVGARRRWWFESQGVRIGNLIVV
ncbi:hypothetical protein EJ06DRAFT_485501, partial [Trichodelitschia bisporula]